jgi:hypothetical protein
MTIRQVGKVTRMKIIGRENDRVLIRHKRKM